MVKINSKEEQKFAISCVIRIKGPQDMLKILIITKGEIL